MKLHHAGFVIADREKFISRLIYENKVKEVYDPAQDAFLVLLTNYSDSFIELIQPLSEKSPTSNVLKQNGDGFHHFCYELDPTDALDDIVRKHKLIKVFGPVPALLFDGREVVFHF